MADDGFPGRLAQTLPRSADFEAAAQLLSRDAVPGLFACRSDVDEHGSQLRSYADAGYDEVYVQQIGPDKEGFFSAYAKEVLPALRG